MKQYYKILHEGMKHYDMQYHLGLNEDVKPFNPKPVCGGGLFFSDKEHVLDYLKYNEGTKLAIIEVPEDEKIVKVNDKYKAHRIIIKEIKDLWSIENHDLLKGIFSNTKIFENACINDNLDYAKWLYKQGEVNIYVNDAYVFQYVCEDGHLEMAKWLYDLGKKKNQTIDQTILYDVFKFCANGYLEVEKWLYSLGGIDIHAEDDFAFRCACIEGYLDIAKWLYGLDKIDIHVDNNIIFRYSPEYVLNWLKTL